MRYWGLFAALFGAAIWRLAYTKWCRKGSRGVAVGVGVGCILLGGAVAVLDLLGLEWGLYILLSACFSAPLLLCGLGGFLLSLRCRLPAEGVCLPMVLQEQEGGRVTPLFRYRWEGREHTELCAKSCAPGTYSRRYRAGEVYPIFLNPRRPQEYLLRRRPRWGDWVMTGFGLIILVMPILLGWGLSRGALAVI